MKSTELIKGKWYVNARCQLIKFEIFRYRTTYCSSFIDSKSEKLHIALSIYSCSNVIREATIDDFPKKFKHLFNNSIIEPTYEVY